MIATSNSQIDITTGRATLNSSLTLPADLTKIDVDIEPFWNEQSTELHSILWQPHKTESQDQPDESNFWKKTFSPNNSTQQHVFYSFTSSSSFHYN